MISLVCVYKDKNILDNYLLKSLKEQKNSYELILLDNTQNKFKSAAETLNYGGNQASGEYIMFVHQDLELSSQDWLQEVEGVLESLKDMGVVGVAGTKDHCNISNMKHGHPPKLAGLQLEGPVSVETVDECLAIIPRKLFYKFQFDEEVCQGWHLYVVDYCLTLKNEGYQVYVIPNYCYHLSAGYSFSEDYYTTLRKLTNKHSNIIIGLIQLLETGTPLIPCFYRYYTIRPINFAQNSLKSSWIILNLKFNYSKIILWIKKFLYRRMPHAPSISTKK